MKKTLWFASQNINKINEVKNFLAETDVQLFSLLDLSDPITAKETEPTFVGNARKKAISLASIIHQPILADDSGLCIKALNNFPGVHTKRWMKNNVTNLERNNALLEKMQGAKSRYAEAVCALYFVDLSRNFKKVFKGVCRGIITKKVSPGNDFGFDPIFYMPRYKKTLAEMTPEFKNQLSHRGIALKRFMTWYKEHY